MSSELRACLAAFEKWHCEKYGLKGFIATGTWDGWQAAWNHRAPMELTDSEIGRLFSHLQSASRDFMGQPQPMQDYGDNHDAFIAKVARQWLAERSGG